MIKVVYCGQVHDFSGYGIAARDYVECLAKHENVDLKVYPIIASKTDKIREEHKSIIEAHSFKSDKEIDDFIKNGDYICIWHMVPIMGLTSDLRFETSHRHSKRLAEIVKKSQTNINYLAWETDKLPKSYVDSLRYYNCKNVWVPSSWNKKVVESSMPEVTATVIPHVTDKVIYKDKEIKFPFSLEDKFVVFSSSQWTERKGFDCLVKSFLSEFYHEEKAILIIKTIVSPTDSEEVIRNKINHYKRIISKNRNDFKCKVVLLTGYYSNEKLQWLYNNSSIYASLTRGEGFGLTIAEAINNRLPVLVPSDGGHTDYLCKESNFIVDGMWDACLMPLEPYEHDSNWFQPSIKSSKEQLRKAFVMWETDPTGLQNMTEQSHEYFLSKKMNLDSIKERVYDNLVGLYKTPLSDTRSLITRAFSIEQKLELLKDSYAGKDCYILTCGPSLQDYSKQFLDDFLKDKLVLSIKQAYTRHPEVTDFHFFNCSNLPQPSNGIEHYSYGDDGPIVVASSNYPDGSRWSQLQKKDLFFKIPIRTEIENEFICFTKEFDKYLLDSSITRPCGPGIMLETVIFMAVHLGVKNIFALGWDLSYNNIQRVDDYKHFFGSTKKLHNRGDILDWEIQATREVSKDLFYWLKDRGINLNLASEQSSLYENIPRVKL